MDTTTMRKDIRIQIPRKETNNMIPIKTVQLGARRHQEKRKELARNKKVKIMEK
jgi:hypothetical protein